MKIYKKRILTKENKNLIFKATNLIQHKEIYLQTLNYKKILKLIFFYRKFNKKILIIDELSNIEKNFKSKKNINFHSIYSINNLKFHEINKQNLIIVFLINKKKIIEKIIDFTKLTKKTTILFSLYNDEEPFLKKNFVDYFIDLNPENYIENKKKTEFLLKSVL